MSSFFEDERNLRIKGYFSMLGNLLTTFVTKNILSFLLFTSYYNLYLKKNEIETIRHSTRIFISLIITFSYLSNLLSIFLSYKLNIRTTIFISYFLIMSSLLLLYYSLNVYIIYLAFSIYGFGISFSDFPLSNNTNNFFPEKKNLISFINFLLTSLSSISFYFFLEYIITLKNGNYIIGIKSYLYYLIIIYIIFGLISITITFDYDYELFDESEFENTELSMMDETNPNLEIENQVNDISIINKKDSSFSVYKNLRIKTNLKKRKYSDRSNQSKKASDADILYFASTLDNDNTFYLNLCHGIMDKNFWVISLYYICSMIIIYNFFIKIKEMEIIRFLISVSSFRILLFFVIDFFGSKFISLITVFILILLIILDQYYNLTHLQKILCIVGQGFSYAVYTINIIHMYPQKLNQGSVYILSSLIFTFGCISLWLNIFFRINKFKEPDMEFTILLIVSFLSILFLLMIKGPFILLCKSNTKEVKIYESSSEEEEKK